MKNLLQVHGIKVINNQIAKADLEKAIEVIAAPIKRSKQELIDLKLVEEWGEHISDIKNPSEAVQLAAVQKSGFSIWRINNPSEAVKLAAVKQDGEAIRFIKNPSEAIQLAAMEQNKKAIKFIEKPSKNLKIQKPKSLNLKAFWNSFPIPFKKDFKDFDSGIGDGDSFRVMYKKAFKGKRSLYDQFLVFEFVGDSVEVSYETYERHTGSGGNSGHIGTYSTDNTDVIIKAILKADVFGN